MQTMPGIDRSQIMNMNTTQLDLSGLKIRGIGLAISWGLSGPKIRGSELAIDCKSRVRIIE